MHANLIIYIIIYKIDFIKAFRNTLCVAMICATIIKQKSPFQLRNGLFCLLFYGQADHENNLIFYNFAINANIILYVFFKVVFLEN